MFKADQTVTLITCHTDGAADQTLFTCRVFHGCSWVSTHAARAERNGAAPAPVVKIRIPEPAGGFGEVLPLDSRALLVRGEVEAVPDRKALAGYETARVKAWHDHRDTAFPHIYIEGSL